jgi:uncharacterized protein
MTLLSVMQGIVFTSMVVEVVSSIKTLNYNFLLFFSVLFFSVVLWHKYVNHHQILGWQLGPFDTINIAFFGLLQAFMVANAKAYQSANGEEAFLRHTEYFLVIVFVSVMLAVISYAHSGSESCKDYVKNVITEHYNTCSKCSNGNAHCIYNPADLYQFLIGFEARCLIGTIEVCFYIFIDLVLLLFIVFISDKTPFVLSVSSMLSIIIYFLVTLYYVWRFEFKREINDQEKMNRTLEMGRFIVNNKNKDKLLFWVFSVPKKFFFSFSPFFEVKEFFLAKNKRRETNLNECNKKTVLITGGATGIGYELSKLFARDNYNLILVARDKDRLNEVSVELEKEFNVIVTTISKDLSSPNSAEELYHDVCCAGCHVDVLVNNAGIANYGKFTDSDIKKQIKLINLNITSLSILCRLFGNDMASSRSGAILNVASVAAFQAGPLMSTYYASKAYVLLFSEALKNELQEDGVKVAVLCPGPTKTEFFQRNSWTGSKVETSHYLMSAADVAEYGYRGLLQGRTVLIPGIINKLSIFLVRFLPRSLINMITCHLNKRH